VSGQIEAVLPFWLDRPDEEALDIALEARADWSDRAYGPGLHEALAWLDCIIEAEHRAGDHSIVIGRVCSAEIETRSTSEPLAFFRGDYGTFARPGSTRPVHQIKEFAS
jgi:flavin reductase (DIM6/NTAB) family NADH-FMN oxidoreductase RutF